MNLPNRFIQAYKQAPWRVQLQWFGLFLLGLVAAVLIAGVYLNITSRAASAGLEIQRLEKTKEAIQRSIADQRTTLGHLTSESLMKSRALELGFEDTNPADLTFIVVDGYPGRQTVILAPAPEPNRVQVPLIKPAYTRSLWEVIFAGVLTTSTEPEKGESK